MIDEDIVTSGYEVYVEQPNGRFEPAIMEDEYPPSGPRASRAGAQIVCPAGLGLRHLERGVSGTSEVVLVKPTVVLETVVDELAGGDQATGF
ncbi:hypothetical protein DAEQUDRAFT_729684 [Daedalea quercina L-15889]|uniref:Uncharacterized protein n=1 Tax=Daedalea quercina L-15889 TaxID=1314783 RepID=A0A165NFJ2_9APHY|nr:hypothetical protein DAEQUDRAFT_729684 [Daedalea quercina L-15889]